MIPMQLLEEVIGKALSTGGDFAEIYVEDKIINTIKMVNGNVGAAVSGREFGIGIRIFDKVKSVYTYTNNKSRSALLDTAYEAACMLKNCKQEVSINLREKNFTSAYLILRVPSSISNMEKMKFMKTACMAAKNYSNEIIRATVNFEDTDQSILIANSDGLYIKDRRIRTRLTVGSVASKSSESQTNYKSISGMMGLELFDNVDVESYGKEASKTAVTMLHADACPAERMPVAIESGFGGVFIHEACGHALEATSVAMKESVFSEKKEKKIASSILTLVDDGTLQNLIGSSNIDDEGNFTRRNVLIENGILKGYMVDRLNGRRMNATSTGNSRRQSYKFAPASRMTNTFIMPSASALK